MVTEMDFIDGKGYTLEKIEKTDYINSTPYLLFSKRFVEKVGDVLCEDMQFFSCNLSCQGVGLDWYAARIMRRLPIIDKEKTTFSTLTDEVTKVVSIPKYRKDIEEPFGVARDEEYIAYWVVSELFMNLCKNNGLQLLFNEV